MLATRTNRSVPEELDEPIAAAALREAAGGTVVRIGYDRAGTAAYEARVVRPDGRPVTIRLGPDLEVVGVEDG